MGSGRFYVSFARRVVPFIVCTPVNHPMLPCFSMAGVQTVPALVASTAHALSAILESCVESVKKAPNITQGSTAAKPAQIPGFCRV